MNDSSRIANHRFRAGMNLFIDTSVFIDVLRSKQVESSKSLFKSLQESSNKGFASVLL